MPEKKYEHLKGNFVHFPRVIERGEQPRELENQKVFVRDVDGNKVKTTLPTPYKDFEYEWEIPEDEEPSIIDPSELPQPLKKFLVSSRKLLNHEALSNLSFELPEEKGLLTWMKENDVQLSKEDEKMLEHLQLLSDETILAALKKAKEKGLVDRYWEIQP